MIENRKENIGVINQKTGEILANIDEVKDAVISSKKNTVITLSDEVT
jgi:hypothetical protein